MQQLYKINNITHTKRERERIQETFLLFIDKHFKILEIFQAFFADFTALVSLLLVKFNLIISDSLNIFNNVTNQFF